MIKPFAIVCAAGLMITVNAVADDEPSAQPPVLPDQMESGESIEPDINIIERDDRIIEEYRANGQLYMIKVIPNVGKPYYLMDTDGDGSLETRRGNLASPEVPNWILFEW